MADEFDPKADYQAGKINVLTKKAAAQLAASPDFDARAKAHCFFSAKVAEARILTRLRSITDAYVTGKADRSTAIADLQDFLRGDGYQTGEGVKPPPGLSEEDWKRARKLSNLASTSRLGLILDTNRREAEAVRRYSDMRKSGAPYLRYVESYKRDKRPSHRALVGMVLPADHPFWQHFPRDYNCGCSYEEVWPDELADSGGAGEATRDDAGNWRFTRGGQTITDPANPSGFDFDVSGAFADCDMSRIDDPAMRRDVYRDLADYCAKNNAQTTLISKADPAGNGVRQPENLDQIHQALASVKAEYDRAKAAGGQPKYPAIDISLGEVLPGHAAQLGIPAKEMQLRYVSPGGAKYGPEHWDNHHADTLEPERAQELFFRTVWRENAKAELQIEGKSKRLVFREPGAGRAVTVFKMVGGQWVFNVIDTWELSDLYVAAKIKK